ncbi:TetR/AcrR family transcriptional regulator [Nocardia salmonicida]|uniref:TetR/AcrR family transcriptional regulator n=1 Tax=Nocardia salmonicida TaxID=53431 RepID=UPI0037BDE87B
MARSGSAGKRNTGTREKLLDATARLMLEEGYAAVTSRRVAEVVGVQRAVVHYYFPTMDDLFLAVLRRGTHDNIERQRRALASDSPLHALWDLTFDQRGSRLTMEFMALGNHRKDIRAELAAGAERFREAQIAALTLILRGHVDSTSLPPEVASVLIAAIGRLLVLENALGIATGHEQTLALVRAHLERYEPSPSTEESAT